MKTYKVRGLYTISFEMEVEAKDKYDAIDVAYDECDITTEWNGNSVFSNYGNCELNADGEPRDIEVIECTGEVDDDEEEEDEEYDD